MACYTQEEIGEKEGLTQQAIDLILQEKATFPKLVKSDKSLQGPVPPMGTPCTSEKLF